MPDVVFVLADQDSTAFVREARTAHTCGIRLEAASVVVLRTMPETDAICVVGVNRWSNLDRVCEGRRDAYVLASFLAKELKRPVRWSLFPDAARSLTEWIKCRGAQSPVEKSDAGLLLRLGAYAKGKILEASTVAYPDWHQVEPSLVVKCENPLPQLLAGRIGRRFAGKGCVADLSCHGLRCLGCRAQRRNAWIEHLGKEIAELCDPAHCSQEITPGWNDFTRAGPWGLAAGIVNGEQWRALQRHFSRIQKYDASEVEHVTIDLADDRHAQTVAIALSQVSKGNESIEEPLLTCDKAQAVGRMFVVAAFSPRIKIAAPLSPVHASLIVPIIAMAIDGMKAPKNAQRWQPIAVYRRLELRWAARFYCAWHHHHPGRDIVLHLEKRRFACVEA